MIKKARGWKRERGRGGERRGEGGGREGWSLASVCLCWYLSFSLCAFLFVFVFVCDCVFKSPSGSTFCSDGRSQIHVLYRCTVQTCADVNPQMQTQTQRQIWSDKKVVTPLAWYTRLVCTFAALTARQILAALPLERALLLTALCSCVGHHNVGIIMNCRFFAVAFTLFVCLCAIYQDDRALLITSTTLITSTASITIISTLSTPDSVQFPRCLRTEKSSM